MFDFLKGKSGKKKSPSRGRGEPRFFSDIDDNSGGRPLAGPAAQGRSVAKKKKPARGKGRTPAKEFFVWLFWFCFRIGLAAGVIMAIFLSFLYLNLPDISTLSQFKKKPSIIVKAEDGAVLGAYGDVYGDYVPYDQLPQNLINAVMATEDRNFFHHFGIDPLGMLRATYVNMKARRVVQGGSTITQQVAKNVFLTPERTFKRKLEEMMLAIELERRYSKQEIMTIYLNRVYMGAANYGVDSASRRYFGHSVRETNLSEDAILVGLLKAPTRYAPTNNPDLSEKRATQVLLNMQDAGYLTDEQVKQAEDNFGDEDSSYRDHHRFGSFYFSDYVVGLLPEFIGEQQDDIVVTTTLNPQWQDNAEDAINTIMDASGKKKNASQAALVSMAPDGAIKAMVGGRNYRASQFNRVTQALRQPGSSFKLFVYLAGLEAGYTPQSEMVDQPVSIGKWHPRDYTGKYQGNMTLEHAFAESINSIAVQLSEAVGREKVVAMAHRLGISSEIEADPSIALGTTEVTLLDMTRAYAHLASNGVSVLPYAIKRIQTTDGRLLYDRNAVAGGEVLSQPVVRMMNDMLVAVTTTGTGRGARFGRMIAGKTGTTSDYKDAWFIGFTPNLVTGVWVGNDDSKPMKKVSGGSLPASIWREFMSASLKKEPVMEIPMQGGPDLLNRLLPWLSPSQPLTPPGAANAVPQPTPMPHPAQQPSQQPPQSQPQAQPAQPQDNRAPEDEPVPEYNAPQSFWDKLLGN
ncbi:MAG TPA: PBP1A family penicillin-binding protein [Rickettsiales bacterium]|nr:PBP1A family penicillin-binding protein [Rickettsiales bacterium]